MRTALILCFLLLSACGTVQVYEESKNIKRIEFKGKGVALPRQALLSDFRHNYPVYACSSTKILRIINNPAASSGVSGGWVSLYFAPRGGELNPAEIKANGAHEFCELVFGNAAIADTAPLL